MMTEEDFYRLIEKNKNLEISKSVQVAVKWWADRMDGTFDSLQVAAEQAEQTLPESFETDPAKWLILQLFIKAAKSRNRESEFIPKNQSEVFRKNLKILLQLEINQRGHCLLSTDEDRAWGTLALACYLSKIDHDNLMSLPLNVDMFVEPQKVEVKCSDLDKEETLYDQKQMAIGKGLYK